MIKTRNATASCKNIPPKNIAIGVKAALYYYDRTDKESIKLQKLRGSDEIKFYIIEKYIRYAQPFTVIILVILGVIIASRKSRQGTGYLIALGFSFAFIFIIMFVMTRAFAENGTLDPLIAVWLPNLIFSGLTYYLYRQVPK